MRSIVDILEKLDIDNVSLDNSLSDAIINIISTEKSNSIDIYNNILSLLKKQGFEEYLENLDMKFDNYVNILNKKKCKCVSYYGNNYVKYIRFSDTRKHNISKTNPLFCIYITLNKKNSLEYYTEVNEFYENKLYIEAFKDELKRIF